MKHFITEKIKFFLNRRFLTFLIIGVANTTTAQLLYMLFVTFGCPVGLSSALGDVISVVVSYVLNIKFTYQVKHSWRLFVTFPISYVPGWIINYLIVVLGVFLGVPELFAKLVSLPITIPLNYVVMSMIVKVRGKENVD